MCMYEWMEFRCTGITGIAALPHGHTGSPTHTPAHPWCWQPPLTHQHAHGDECVQALVRILVINTIEQLQQAACAQEGVIEEAACMWVLAGRLLCREKGYGLCSHAAHSCIASSLKSAATPTHGPPHSPHSRSRRATPLTHTQQASSRCLLTAHVTRDGAHHAEVIIDEPAAALRIHRHVACVCECV